MTSVLRSVGFALAVLTGILVDRASVWIVVVVLFLAALFNAVPEDA